MSRSDYQKFWEGINRATDLRNRKEMRAKHKAILRTTMAAMFDTKKALEIYDLFYQVELAGDDYMAAYFRLKLDDLLREEVDWKNENVG